MQVVRTRDLYSRDGTEGVREGERLESKTNRAWVMMEGQSVIEMEKLVQGMPYPNLSLENSKVTTPILNQRCKRRSSRVKRPITFVRVWTKPNPIFFHMFE